MKLKNRITKLYFSIALTMVVLVAGSISTVSAVSNVENAPDDWAFTTESVELNDAIIEEYSTIDINGDGFISISEAQNWEGSGFILSNKNIHGTLDGIEYITSLKVLNLSQNNITGEIPSTISNLIQLEELYLYENQITGSIPSSLGNMTALKFVKLRGNALTGEIPSSLGNLSNLKILELKTNQLTGQIPSSLGNLVQLTSLTLSNNNFSGGIPSTFKDLVNVSIFEIYNNSLLNILKLKEQPSILLDTLTQDDINMANNDLLNMPPNITQGDKSSTLQPIIDNAQILLDNKMNAEGKTKDLLNTNRDNLNENITINEINNAQDAVNLLPDSSIKTELQADIDLAQQMLAAKTKVDTLLTADGTNLQAGITMEDVEAAQNLVTALPDGTLKEELQAKVDTARDMLVAKKKTESLINADGSLGVGVDQSRIDEAQEAVNKLPNGSLKDNLQKIIDQAQKLLDQKNKTNNLSIKPSIRGGTTVNKAGVNTSDVTDVASLFTILGISIFTILLVIKRKKQVEL